MHRAKKRLLIGFACVGLIVMLLLLAVALTPKLLANRDLVKSYIVTKIAKLTGGSLDYEHIGIGYLPWPHLVAQGIRLTQPGRFSLQARELSIYPRILAMLRGRLSIRQLVLSTPDIQMHLSRMAAPPTTPSKMDETGPGLVPAAIDRPIKAVFGALTVIDPQTQVEIEQGRARLEVPDGPAVQITRITASLERTSAGLSLDLSCSANLFKAMDLQASVDVAQSKAEGTIAFTGIHPHLLLSYLSPPRSITLAETAVDANLDFTIAGTDRAKCRFQFQTPALGLTRDNRRLNVSTASLAGEMAYEENQLSLRLDTIATRQPPLDLSANAVLQHDEGTGITNLQLGAAANQLDIAVASDVTRAIAGDQESIRTAFDVARAGILHNPVYSVAFARDSDGWRLKKMNATGRLSQGLVRISGINAQVENVDGDVVYEDDHVDFSNLSGRFEGATFDKLDVAIDWANQATLSIRSPSVDVEAAPFFNWLTGFEALAGIKQLVSTISGRAAVSRLNISGLLSEPAKWDMDIVASPQYLVLNTSQAPFDIRLSGGEIRYRPGKDRSSNVGIEFLDASFIASHQSSGTRDAPIVNVQADGSAGADTLAWIGTLAPIPDQLQINPPVSLTGINLTWNQGAGFSLTGGLKTAQDISLTVDIAQSPEKLDIREIKFSDGPSKALITASKKDAWVDLTFTGNIEKETVDRLLKTNQMLTGRIEGDFKTRINTGTPLNSTFVGKLSGNGLRLPDLAAIPITVEHFAVVGLGNRLTIQPSEVILDDTRLQVDGTLVPREQALLFDMNVNSDRLDVALIQAFQSDEKTSGTADEVKTPPSIVPSGTIHFQTQSLTYGEFTWSPVQADIRIESDSTFVTINQARLCGISTTGDLDITPQGIGLNISPLASNASLQRTYDCLWDKYVRVDARYDLVGNIFLPPTQEDPVSALSGQATFSSQNGRIYESNTLLKIFSVLNITELFTGGKSDLNKEGYGYSKAWIKARFDSGKLNLDEVLLDGNALKITGQGSIDMKAATADIMVLAAPLKTVDRLVNTIPIFRYITGGSLISVPLRLHGKIRDLSVVPLPPSAVGRGLLKLMERTLKAPFKLVEGAAGAVSEKTRKENEESKTTAPPEP